MKPPTRFLNRWVLAPLACVASWASVLGYVNALLEGSWLHAVANAGLVLLNVYYVLVNFGITQIRLRGRT